MTSMNRSPLALHVHERGWKIEAAVRGVAGTLVLVSAVLTWLVSPWWLLLTAFVGLNLLQSSLTNYCLMNNFIAMLRGNVAHEN